ncbi:MAG TPA: hypothetical protein VMH22_07980 [bacterium]|nr:hypothetical protein [bacterium]
MHYFVDGAVNKGRLCARGNCANTVLDHRERLCRPLLDGHDTTWPEAEALVRQWLSEVKPQELGLVYSRGRTAADTRQLRGLAQELGTPNLACAHIEPESGFDYRLEGVTDASLAAIESAQVSLLVGDVFNTSPVASWRIIEARYADRKNRLVVIDSIRTRQSGFAHVFIQVRPGTEPFALLVLSALIAPKTVLGVDVDRYARVAGVERRLLETTAAMLGAKVPGFVGSAMHTGRVSYPALHSLASQLVAHVAGKSFNGFRETRLPAGPKRFSDIRKAMTEGRLKMLFWTGGLFPYSYEELLPELAKVEHLVATSIFSPDPPVRGLVLPLTADLEQASLASSYWGPVERSPLAMPLSGTRLFSDVLAWFGRADEVAEPEPRRFDVDEVVAMADRAKVTTKAPAEWLLVGEKKAIGLRGFHDPEEEISVCHADVGKLDVASGSYLRVKSPSATREFRVRVSEAVPAGVLMVGTNVHANRTLFPLVDNSLTGETTVTPVPVELEKAGRTARAAGENPSVWT